MNYIEKQARYEIALLKDALQYTLEYGYQFTLAPEVNEERADMYALLEKLKSGRWILTPVPW